VSNSGSIAINYVKSWFVVDLFAALPFDLIYATDFNGEMRVNVLIATASDMVRYSGHLLRIFS